PSRDPVAPGVGDEEAAGRDVAAAAGSPLADVLPLAEPVLELEVSSNRVDCLGVYGVAREVHAFSGAPLAGPPWEGDADAAGAGQASDHASVTVEAPELCPRFTARVFTDVAVGPSPLWLKARLMVDLCGAKLVPGTIDVAAEFPPVQRVRLRPRRADALLGMRIEAELCATYLERLGFVVERATGDLVAEVPVHRYYDVSREAD